MPSNALVSGHTGFYEPLNGIYVYSGLDENNYPYYKKTDWEEGDPFLRVDILSDPIRWSFIYPEEGPWVDFNSNPEGTLAGYESISLESLPSFPWEVSEWIPVDVANDEDDMTVNEVLAVVDPIAERDAKYATATEEGAKRFRRLFSLGYV